MPSGVASLRDLTASLVRLSVNISDSLTRNEDDPITDICLGKVSFAANATKNAPASLIVMRITSAM